MSVGLFPSSDTGTSLALSRANQEVVHMSRPYAAGVWWFCLALLAGVLGCGTKGEGLGQGAARLSATGGLEAGLSFGSVTVGQSQQMALDLFNSGGAPLTLTQSALTGAGFSTVSLALPLTLAPNQSATVAVQFAPTANGAVQGALVLTSNAVNSPTTFPLDGTGVGGATQAPYSLWVSTAPSRSAPHPLDGSQLSGLVYIFTSDATGTANPAGIQSVSYWLDNPGMTGTPTHVETVTPYDFVGTASDGSAEPFDTSTLSAGSHSIAQSVALTSGVAADDVTATFKVGSGSTADAGVTSVTYPGTWTANGLTISGLSVTEITSTSATVNWTTSAAADSQVWLSTVPGGTSAGGTWLADVGTPVTSHVYPLTGLQPGVVYYFLTESSAQPGGACCTDSAIETFETFQAGTSGSPQLSVSPSSLSFGTVSVGASKTLSVKLTSTGSASLTVSQVSGAGSGVSVSGLSLPLTLAPNASATASVTFAPTSAGTFSGTLSIESTDPHSPTTVAWSGSGAAISSGPVPAFPGAEGGGAPAVGGRKGVIYEVTNLNDSGSGSLRACIEASGPRTCIFRVNGLITFLSRVQASDPFLTIAGQSAPGEVVIGGPNQKGEQLFVSSHDVVVRYLTYDGNNPNTPTGPDTGTVCCEMASGDVYNIVWDHMSARWMGNKAFPLVSNVSGMGIHNISIQWTLLYEPNVQHAVGIGTVYVSTGSGLATTDDDAHHNMFITVDHRLPLNQSGRNVRWVNNLIYNWGQFAALSMGGVQTDYIGNKYVDGTGGNLDYNSTHVFIANGNGCDPNDPVGDCPGGNNETGPTMYLLNNTGRTGSAMGSPMVTPTQTPNDPGQVSMTAQGWEGGDTGDPNSQGAWPFSWFRSGPLPTEQFPIEADDVANLDNVLIPTVGNSQHLDCLGNWVSHRNSEDARVIGVYQTRAADDLFTGQHSAPAVATGTPCTESLHDGIPDQWKARYGLSTTDASLYQTVDPATGYTYLEDYLNGIAP
jgi:hypothetical protein